MSEEILRAVIPQLVENFSPLTKTRGHLFFKEGRIHNLAVNFQKMRLTADVQDERRSYGVEVMLRMDSESLAVEQSCNCPTGSSCKHIYAVLLAVDNMLKLKPEQEAAPILPETTTPIVVPPPPPKLSAPLNEWLFKVEQQFKTETESTVDLGDKKVVVWRLNCSHTIEGSKLSLSMEVVRMLRNGEYSRSAPQQCCIADLLRSYSSTSQIKHMMTERDWNIITWLARTQSDSLNYTTISLLTTPSIEFFKELLETERCYLRDIFSSPLQWGEERAAKISWQLNSSGNAQKAVCRDPNPNIAFFIEGDTPFYIDQSNIKAGLLSFQAPLPMIKALLAAPPVPHKDLAVFQETIKERFPQLAIYVPRPVEKKAIIEKPINCLRFEVRKKGNEERVVGLLSFEYAGHRVPLGASSNSITYETITNVQKNDEEMLSIHHATDLEKQAVKTLISMRWDFSISYEMGRHQVLFRSTLRSKDLMQEVLTTLDVCKKQLERRGWKIEIDDSLPFNTVIRADDTWFLETEVSEGDWKEQDWFDLRLGTYINGRRVNLLPALAKFMKNEENPCDNLLETLREKDPKELFPIPTIDKEIIMVPVERLCSILEVLAGQISGLDSLTSEGALKVSRWNAALLAELSKAQDAAAMRCIGPESLFEFAYKIKGYQTFPIIEPPKGLKCQLRSYQQEGLNWLQFLHSCNLNGILADDMGLGKTIQTLAHILVEKEQGRIRLPILIIAPTSLMPNWKAETTRFAPELKVLVLQGMNRHQYFNQVSHHDIILTTYPLLMRDKENLLAHEFHMLILDEAQVIKNSDTQAYQIVQQIKAKHRLCLSGTPMENHLGELWSLFNFLLPGFLGDRKQFQNVYRKPIEKDGDTIRQTALRKRIKPFMLRRTKQLVATELPPKTEIIQPIELGVKQRDLYEAIRLKAQADLMEQIREKGLARSQIAVLDALLKLRQVCCDPRLIKTDKKVSDAESAKLDFLMDTLPQMIEENRKILIFSQFTSMLALVEKELQAENITYTMLTGNTTDRSTPVATFQSGSVPVMLLSLKAGGTGLNLTAADVVFFLDPWWNPAAEDQAADRAYRIGQTKAVFVYKLVSTGTVEEKILSLQERKRSLSAGLFEEKEGGTVALTMDDIEQIFAPIPQ